MKLDFLSSLVAIIDHGSLAAAANHVGCSPSAISLQVKQLEAWFGRPLFDRSARAVAAPALCPRSGHGRPRRGAPPRCPARAADAEACPAGSASAPSPASRPVPWRRRCACCAIAIPDLHVEIALQDSDPLLAALKAGRIDAAVLVRPSSGGSSRLAWQNLERQPFVMLAPAGAANGSPKELAAAAWADPVRSGIDRRPHRGALRAPALPQGATRHGIALDRRHRRHGGGGARRVDRAAAAPGAAGGASRAGSAAGQGGPRAPDRLRAATLQFGQPQPRCRLSGLRGDVPTAIACGLTMGDDDPRLELF